MRWRYELAVSPNFFLVLLNNVCPVQEWSSLLQVTERIAGIPYSLLTSVVSASNCPRSGRPRCWRLFHWTMTATTAAAGTHLTVVSPRLRGS